MKIGKRKKQIKTAEELIRNGGDCTQVNCKHCYYYKYLMECVHSGHIADRYQENPKLVVEKSKEFLKNQVNGK